MNISQAYKKFIPFLKECNSGDNANLKGDFLKQLAAEVDRASKCKTPLDTHSLVLILLHCSLTHLQEKLTLILGTILSFSILQETKDTQPEILEKSLRHM